MRDLLDAMTAIEAAAFTLDEGDSRRSLKQPMLRKLR